MLFKFEWKDMPQFLTAAHRTLLIIYVLLILPVVISVLSGRSMPFLDRTPWKILIDREREQVVVKAKMKTLNLYRPESFEVLRQLTDDPAKVNGAVLGAHIRYFKELAEILPAPLSADAHAMLGFCYAHQGNWVQAAQSLTKAIEVNPVFLWPYFNLAYVYFQQGDYSRSSEWIGRMLTLNPELSMRILSGSKIYTDIIRDGQDYDFGARLAGAYADALRMLVISQYRLKNYTEVISASRYALSRGIGPAEFFNFYAALGSATDQDRLKADAALLQAQQRGAAYTAQDVTAKFF